MECRTCKKDFEPWNVEILRPPQAKGQVFAALICRDCAKPEIEDGIIRESRD